MGITNEYKRFPVEIHGPETTLLGTKTTLVWHRNDTPTTLQWHCLTRFSPIYLCHTIPKWHPNDTQMTLNDTKWHSEPDLCGFFFKVDAVSNRVKPCQWTHRRLQTVSNRVIWKILKNQPFGLSWDRLWGVSIGDEPFQHISYSSLSIGTHNLYVLDPLPSCKDIKNLKGEESTQQYLGLILESINSIGSN